MAYRQKYTKKQEARMDIGTGIFGLCVSIPFAVFGFVAAVSIITGDKGTLVERIIGSIGIAIFFGGAGIGGIVACGRGLLDGIKSHRELKKTSMDQHSELLDPEQKLKDRGITRDNYHLHLDEMTDQEITLMLDLTEGKKYMDAQRKAYPQETDRTRAEFLRDF